MKKLNILSALILGSVFILPMMAETDHIVMTVNGTDVTRSEFEYSYKKNNGPEVLDRKTVNDYVGLFVNYKLKVQAALDAKLDTLSGYKAEFTKYRDAQVLPTIINDADVEREARVIYDDTKKNIGPDGLLKLSHILIRVGQNDSDDKMKEQHQRADSIYNALRGGADFATLAKEKSQDPGSAQRGGLLGWISKGRTLKAFEDAAFALKDGEMSQPVLSEVGYHIILREASKQLEPFDSLREDIYKFIDRRNVRQSIAQNRLKQISEAEGVNEEQVMNERIDSIVAVSPEMRYLIQEYHDGLLLYEVCNRQVWQPVAADKAKQEAFFKKNMKKYKWDEPRFKGIAYYTRDEKDIDAVKKSVKGKPFSEWTETLRSTFNGDSILRIRVEKGIFKKGMNTLVDRYEYKDESVTPKEKKDYPYMATYGKMLKTPEELSDVAALVQADCQEAEEKAWLETLKKKYPVKIYWDEIKKINDVQEVQ